MCVEAPAFTSLTGQSPSPLHQPALTSPQLRFGPPTDNISPASSAVVLCLLQR